MKTIDIKYNQRLPKWNENKEYKMEKEKEVKETKEWTQEDIELLKKYLMGGK